MTIRPAEAADADAIAALWNTMIRSTLATFTTQEKTAPVVRELIREREGAFWVADGPALEGFVTYGSFRNGPGYAASIEHSIILAPEAQGKGLGRALMAHAMTQAHMQGFHVMIAGISAANPAAVAFHAALGFKHSGTMQEVGRKHGQWLDLILMQKTLDLS